MKERVLVLLKSPDSRLKNNNNYDVSYPESAISFGSKIYVFQAKKKACLIYDIENNTWSEKHFEVGRNLRYFSCAKIPQC